MTCVNFFIHDRTMSTCSSVSYSSDSDEDIDIEADSPKRTKVMTKKAFKRKHFGENLMTATVQ